MGAEVIAALIAGAVAIIGAYANYRSQQETNESNEAINERNIEFQAGQTQAQWERDDSAHQREVADLQKAGLSPLASTKGALTTSALGAPSPIAMQAPQLDVNTLVQSVLQSEQLKETKRHNLVQEGQKNTENIIDMNRVALLADQVKIENKKVEETIKYNAKYLEHLGNQLSEVERSNKSNESLKELQIRSEEYFKSIQSQTGGKANYEIYTNLEKYNAALQVWSNKFETFINTFISETSTSTSQSYGDNWNTGLGANALGVGGVSGNVGEGKSSSASFSSNVSQKQEAELERFYRTNPMPVYIYHQNKENN